MFILMYQIQYCVRRMHLFELMYIKPHVAFGKQDIKPDLSDILGPS